MVCGTYAEVSISYTYVGTDSGGYVPGGDAGAQADDTQLATPTDDDIAGSESYRWWRLPWRQVGVKPPYPELADVSTRAKLARLEARVDTVIDSMDSFFCAS